MFLVSSRNCLRSIHWSQVLSWEWICSWSSADRRCSNYIWVINNFIAYYGATYIRGFTVLDMEPVGYDLDFNFINVSIWLIACASCSRGPAHKRSCIHAHQKSLCPSEVVWRHRTGSTLAQVMVCCLTATISNVKWHSPGLQFAWAISH